MKRLVSWLEFVDEEPWRFNLAVTAYGMFASTIMVITVLHF
jgi:hypothetical protein